MTLEYVSSGTSSAAVFRSHPPAPVEFTQPPAYTVSFNVTPTPKSITIASYKTNSSTTFAPATEVFHAAVPLPPVFIVVTPSTTSSRVTPPLVYIADPWDIVEVNISTRDFSVIIPITASLFVALVVFLLTWTFHYSSKNS